MRSVTLFAMLWLALAASAQMPKPKAGKTNDFVLGEIHQLYSISLGETRTLNIYLPEGYKANDTTRYPIVYLLDGSADEDFIHVAGLYQFYSFPWIHTVPPSIVVGIANVDRRRDFTFPTTVAADREHYPTTGHSASFIAFLEKDLQPYIERNFRGNGSKTLIGQSLGGLLATELLVTHPDLFNRYVIVSPSLWWDNGSLLERAKGPWPKSFAPGTQVYIGVGKEGLMPGNPPRVMEVDANLLADQLRHCGCTGVQVHFDYLPAEDHATILHPALANALRLFAEPNNAANGTH